MLTVLMNFGFLVFGVTDYMGKKKFALHYGTVVAGEPRTESETVACELLGERLAQRVGVFVDGREVFHPVLHRQDDEDKGDE